jgi:hypothetical protein
VISNQPPAAPGERQPEARTPLNAVFRRLSDRPAAAAPEAPEPPRSETRPAAPPISPAPPRPVLAIAPEPAPIDPRVSFAAAVLARAGAAIAARAARDGETAADPKPPSASTPQFPETLPAARTAAESVPPEPAPADPEPMPVAGAEPPPERKISTPPEPEAPLPLRTAPTALSEPPLPPEPAGIDAAVAPAPEPPTDRRPPTPKLTPGSGPAAAHVPAWLLAPALRIAIPDSPFGRGGAGRPIGEHLPPGKAAEPDTVGFVEIEPPAAPASAMQQVVEFVTPVVDEAANSAAPTPEPLDKPAQPLAAQTPTALQPSEAEPAAETGSESPPRAANTGEPAPAAAEVSVAASAVPEPETGLSEDRAEAPAPLRAARPLGAPQSASRQAMSNPEAAGLPAVEVPPLVEPDEGSADSTETAVGPPRDDRPTMRNRRLYRRVAIEAEFEIDGAAAKLLDLSMGGFAAANAPALAPNAVVPVTVRLAIDGVDISTRMRARIVYAGTPRSGGRFIDLTAGQTGFLRYIVTWRGQSAGALGTATLLEAIGRAPDPFRPAEPPALEPPGRAERRTRWWSRLFGWFHTRGAPE